jgi:hypothetical protein
MSWMPSFWCRSCGPFTLNLEQLRDLRWRLDIMAEPMIFHTSTTAEGTALTMAEAKAWAVARAEVLFSGWLQQAKAIEWRD